MPVRKIYNNYCIVFEQCTKDESIKNIIKNTICGGKKTTEVEQMEKKLISNPDMFIYVTFEDQKMFIPIYKHAMFRYMDYHFIESCIVNNENNNVDESKYNEDELKDYLLDYNGNIYCIPADELKVKTDEEIKFFKTCTAFINKTYTDVYNEFFDENDKFKISKKMQKKLTKKKTHIYNEESKCNYYYDLRHCLSDEIEMIDRLKKETYMIDIIYNNYEKKLYKNILNDTNTLDILREKYSKKMETVNSIIEKCYCANDTEDSKYKKDYNTPKISVHSIDDVKKYYFKNLTSFAGKKLGTNDAFPGEFRRTQFKGVTMHENRIDNVTFEKLFRKRYKFIDEIFNEYTPCDLLSHLEYTEFIDFLNMHIINITLSDFIKASLVSKKGNELKSEYNKKHPKNILFENDYSKTISECNATDYINWTD